MSAIVRLRRRVLAACELPPELRRPYLRLPVERRLPTLFALSALRRLTGRSIIDLAAFLVEVRPGCPLHSHLRAAECEHARLSPAFAGGSGTVSHERGAMLYALARALRPERVIETGTANGASTAYLLAALRRTGHGSLVSIDLPFADARGEITPIVPGSTIGYYDASPLPCGKPPGWMVPDDLRDRWRL